MENSCRKKYKPSHKKWILASRCTGFRRNSALIPANAGLFHYAGNNPIRYIDPDGRSVTGVLRLIRKHRETILAVANKYKVDSVGIASVIFQEKRWGIAADLKDIGAYIWDGGVNGKIDIRSDSTRNFLQFIKSKLNSFIN